MQESSPSEHAASRVQGWFGKEKENHFLLQTELSSPFYQKHQCIPVKPPRIPPQIDHLPLQGYLLAHKKKKKQAKLERVTKGSGFKHVPFKVGPAQKRPISPPKQVELCRFREHFIASKQLKNLSNPTLSGPKRHDVVPIKSAPQKKSQEGSYPTEFEVVKQERHFQIGRVIKYLID